MPTPLRVLIVDDSAVALSFLQAVLKGAKYEVETASTGEDGLEKALSGQPDLIITDSLMPTMDGFELIRQLRAHPQTSHIPIVLLTSGDITSPEYASCDPAPDALVAKSMAIDPLLQTLTLLADRRRNSDKNV